jgi:hypothetical protein
MTDVKRTLRSDGLLFLNMGDTYYSAKGQPKGADKKNKGRRFGLRAVDASGLGFPRKTLLGMPWRVALAMIEDGWILRSSIIWHRHNAVPEATAHDRPWRTYEFVFMFSKSQKYYFDRAKLKPDEDIWEIGTKGNKSNGLHRAAFPEELATRCIQIGSKENQEILDPFMGTGSTIAAATNLKRSGFGIDLKEEFCRFSAERLVLL